ncbi:MmpS family transport accessory protein [Mycolicibacter sp. MYC123]|uniref:MmpS family transport accessory protein n=1 Tax=[Mycobacterium] zoologicum TaxID=2872311 RepID=A0ABU5YJX9_9MYCO|nr:MULTISPECIES: MmpS family transport accessory protein [unclassified Mycolicibacter]MEB3050341.1 MmpS family transport accessory protein [Mycolicibacter sp. MYC123]MEB3062743.1 MmpS family transport accessory protein [Mycolicibacter sp. MYC101]
MRQAWVHLVVAATLCIAGVYIAHLRLSDIPDPAIGHSARPPSAGKLREKVIEYRLDGPVGTVVSASYLDADGTVREVSSTLPWLATLRTRQLTVSSGVIAQADAAPLSCRVTVDGRIRDEQASDSTAVSCEVVVS